MAVIWTEAHLAARALQGAEQFRELRRQLLTAAAQANKKLQSRIAAFRQQLAGSEEADATQKQADLVLANVYRSAH